MLFNNQWVSEAIMTQRKKQFYVKIIKLDVVADTALKEQVIYGYRQHLSVELHGLFSVQPTNSFQAQ